MSATKDASPPRLESSEESDLLKLSRGSGLDLSQLSESRTTDIMGRIRVGDIDGLSETAGIEKKDAIRLARRYNEALSGIEERSVLRTSDARKLEREILSLLAEGASSALARRRLLLLTPTVNVEIIRARLETCLRGRRILDELRRDGKLDGLRTVLAAGLSLEEPGAPKKRGSRSTSDTVRYFLSRKEPIKVAQSILGAEYAKAETLVALFKDIDAGALEEVLKILNGLEGSEGTDAESVVSDAEALINQKLKRGGLDEEKARRIVEEGVDEVVAALKLRSEEEEGLRRAAFEQLSIPFEFDKAGLRRVIQGLNQRQEDERAAKAAKTDNLLRRYLGVVGQAVEKAVLLDQVLAIASAMDRYGMTIPTIGNDGISFIGGRSLFLTKERIEGRGEGAPQPVSYGIGRVRSMPAGIARPRNVVMLTGANSGGKTTLLTTVATIQILALLGLPVPCEKAEVAPFPVYLFRRRVTRKVGSLEQAMSSLIPVFADRRRKLVLMDEFEALTEPGAAGRILATIMNEAAASSSLVLLVTHLARETLPYVKLPIRVDGIEATGLDVHGELIVDRQPRFNHIGSSTPKLIIMKLSQAAKKKNVQSLYKGILDSLESETIPVQTPLTLPWIPEEGDDGSPGQKEEG